MAGLTGILGDNFNSPPSDDPTSAPAMPQVQQPLPSVLSKLKKPTKLKNPNILAAAISRSKRALQRGDKWGS